MTCSHCGKLTESFAFHDCRKLKLYYNEHYALWYAKSPYGENLYFGGKRECLAFMAGYEKRGEE